MCVGGGWVWGVAAVFIGGGGGNRISLVHWNIITHFYGIETHFHLLKKWPFCHINTYHLKVSNTFSKLNHTVNQNTKSLTLTPISFLKETCHNSDSRTARRTECAPAFIEYQSRSRRDFDRDFTKPGKLAKSKYLYILETKFG